MPNSEKSLFQLYSFHFALWTPILVAIIIVIYILVTSKLSFEYGYSGLNNAWDIFKVPLAIFSLVFPSVALVTANHRSIQSKKQIELTAKQNIFKNYFDSIEDFEKYLDSFTFKKSFTYRNKRVLYKRIFPTNTPKFVETTVDKKTLANVKLFYRNSVDNVLRELCNDKYLKQNNMSTLFPDLIVIELYKRLKGIWLIHFGIEVKDENFKRHDSVIDIIHNLTDEFYSLLTYCIEYSITENGIFIVPHEAFKSSSSWLAFKEKIEKQYDCDLNTYDFERINPTSIDLVWKQKTR